VKEQGTWDFGVLLAMIADGEMRDEVSSELHDLTEKLHERAMAAAKAVTGTLTIALDVRVDAGGLVTIEPNITGKLPRKVRRNTPFWVGKHGLTQDNPKQQALFREIREVGGARTLVEPGMRAEGEAS